MPRRHKRMGFLRPELELEQLREARAMLVRLSTEYPINGDAYQRGRKAMEAIDDVAEVLVGDRQYFWLKS